MEIAVPKTTELESSVKVAAVSRVRAMWTKNSRMIYNAFNQPNRFILIIFLSKAIDIITARIYWNFMIWPPGTQGARELPVVAQ